MTNGQKGLFWVGILVMAIIVASMATGWKPGCHGRGCINRFPSPTASVTR